MNSALFVALFALTNGVAAQAPEHRLRITYVITDVAPPDRTWVGFHWHVGYEGRAWLGEQVELAALLSLLPTAFFSASDLSSHLSVRWRPDGWRRQEGATLRLFPFSATRLRATEEPLLGWGGRNPWPFGSSNNTAASAELQRGPWFAQLAVKSGTRLNGLILEQERSAALLARVRWVAPAGFWLEASGMAIPLGVIPGLAAQGIRRDSWTAGGALRIEHNHGTPPAPLQVPARERRVTPEFFELLAQRPPTQADFGWNVSLEGTAFGQQLEDPERFGEVRVVPAWGGRLRATGALGPTRLQAFALARTVELIQSEAPGFPPFRAFPAGTETSPEWRAELAFDHAFALAFGALRAGAVASVQLPATFLPPATTNPRRRVVVRDINHFSFLRTGDEVRPISGLSALLRADLPFFSAVLEAGYRRDDNRTTFRDDLTGVAEPDYLPPHELNLSLYLQAQL